MSAIDSREEVDRMAALYGPRDAVMVPPNRVDAEQAVLGGLMIRPEAWALVSDTLAERDFYRRDHALIWRAIEQLASKGQPYDAVTLGDWFESQGEAAAVQNGAYLIELVSSTPSAANIRSYADIVAEQSCRRRMIEAGSAIASDGYSQDGRDLAEILSEANQRIADLQPAQQGGLQKASKSLNTWFERFSSLYESGQKLTGLPTQWEAFNEVTHGLQPATLYLVAARPSMGKSVFGLNLAMFSALRGKTVGLFSLEMSVNDCHNRNIAALARVPHDWVIAPDRGSDEGYTIAMTPAIRDLKQAPLFIDDTASISVRQFEARARRMHAANPLALLVVDHIHDFKIDPKLARFEYGVIVQTAKNLAKEWNIPVVALAQLNRKVAGRSDKRPTLSDLRESGELEQKGDVIVFLHREDYYDSPESKTHLQGVVELGFAKGRNIRAGARINLRNRFDQMRLDDWEGDLPTPHLTIDKPKTKGYRGYSNRGASND